MTANDFQAEEEPAETTETETAAPVTETMSTATVVEEAPVAPETGAETAPAQPARTPALQVTTYAQLLSTSDQKTAERLAAKMIDGGFTTAYVERGATDKGPVYRVRVRFDSEEAARAAEPKLREFSKEVWITTK